LNRLAKEEESGVWQPANYSLGRASIFNAGEAISKEDFEKELKNALIFFTKSMNDVSDSYSPDFPFANFCLPFYRSFYTLIFKKEDAASMPAGGTATTPANCLIQRKRKRRMHRD
jgi:hypothetical protein